MRIMRDAVGSQNLILQLLSYTFVSSFTPEKHNKLQISFWARVPLQSSPYIPVSTIVGRSSGIN